MITKKLSGAEILPAEDIINNTTASLQHALNNSIKLIDSLLDVVCTIDEEGIFVTINLAVEKQLGYKPVELIGKKYLDLVFGDDLKKTIHTFNGVRNGFPAKVFENQYIHKDGILVPLLWSANWDDTDKMMYCIATNAFERKKLEKAFEIERQQYYNLFVKAPFSMAILKGPGHVHEMCNPLYLQLIGKKDVIGKSVKEVLQEIVGQGFIELLDNVYTSGISFSATERLIRLDREGNGSLTDNYLNFICQPNRNARDVIESIFFFAIDVSEQVQLRKKIEESEKQYRQIVETAQEGIWMIDENSKTIFVNRKMSEIFDCGQQEMIGKTTLYFKEKEEQQSVLQQLEKRKQGISETYETRFITKNGKQIWANVSTNPIFNDEGEYKGALAMITDITPRKEQEIQIIKNLKERELLIAELTKSVNDLKQFTFITSHNFKAPLSNLVGLLRMVDYSTLTETNKEMIEMFKTSTLQLDTTINDLIKILIIKNDTSVNVSNNNINALLDQACATLMHEITVAGCEIKRDFNVENIISNKPYLESILLHLLSNALKFRSPDRPLQINISTQQKLNGKVLIIIKDNGIGIDLHRHGESIFGLYQRFYTGSNGVGLGLFLVKSQVVALGGTIDVESEINKGTAFYLTF